MYVNGLVQMVEQEHNLPFSCNTTFCFHLDCSVLSGGLSGYDTLELMTLISLTD